MVGMINLALPLTSNPYPQGFRRMHNKGGRGYE